MGTVVIGAKVDTARLGEQLAEQFGDVAAAFIADKVAPALDVAASAGEDPADVMRAFARMVEDLGRSLAEEAAPWQAA